MTRGANVTIIKIGYYHVFFLGLSTVLPIVYNQSRLSFYGLTNTNELAARTEQWARGTFTCATPLAKHEKSVIRLTLTNYGHLSATNHNAWFSINKLTFCLYLPISL